MFGNEPDLKMDDKNSGVSSCDLDFDPMTFIYEFDSYLHKMYSQNESEADRHIHMLKCGSAADIGDRIGWYD